MLQVIECVQAAVVRSLSELYSAPFTKATRRSSVTPQDVLRFQLLSTVSLHSLRGQRSIHNAFENAGATLSGVETAYNVLKKKGKIDDTYKFITFGGDGGTDDIGLQSLSGAMERGHDMVYVCYDNGAYMNTGIRAFRSCYSYVC